MVSNLRSDGSLRGVDEPRMLVLKGNEGWHTDSSYMPLAAKASMLSARVVPPSGGETEWADMRAAYDALDDATKERIAGLAAYHSIAWSQAQIGDHTERGSDVYGFQEEVPLRPLVKVHPATGRPALYLGRHAHAIPGLDPEESRRLLDDLVDFACRPPRVLRHRVDRGRPRRVGQPLRPAPGPAVRLRPAQGDGPHQGRRRSRHRAGVRVLDGELRRAWSTSPTRSSSSAPTTWWCSPP